MLIYTWCVCAFTADPTYRSALVIAPIAIATIVANCMFVMLWQPRVFGSEVERKYGHGTFRGFCYGYPPAELPKKRTLLEEYAGYILSGTELPPLPTHIKKEKDAVDELLKQTRKELADSQKVVADSVNDDAKTLADTVVKCATIARDMAAVAEQARKAPVAPVRTPDSQVQRGTCDTCKRSGREVFQLPIDPDANGGTRSVPVCLPRHSDCARDARDTYGPVPARKNGAREGKAPAESGATT